MSFIIPSKYGSADQAPRPYGASDIQVEDLPYCKVAAREFAGFATNQEVVRQRSMLKVCIYVYTNTRL
jgi:hypothetical protein